MDRSCLLVVYSLLLASPTAAQTPTSPTRVPAPTASQAAAPMGFKWQLLPEVKAAMLLPYTWNYKAETSRDAQAYFLTRERIVAGGQFQTGMSLNVVRQMTVKSKQAAAAYAQAFSASSGRKAGQQVLGQESKSQGPLRLFGVRYRVANGAAGAKIIQQWAIANTVTDTFYLLLFESPEKDWPQAWKLGEEMIKQLRLDAGV
ncbi:hypothetical protein [Hymenobacter chitinivorans]|uniref:PsbP C-terminal domain-containing protein n=1 Tax=Hymenobacter chitinivorans DSM 11115 TaxID=1121954 RepID=A0A2M9ASM6_9BACT|nr:hypothetical protein [Hymenobacter chitinivorans]PJJ48643.1 hypothetical protein CLV45_4352 [Hymenobacter chitinivorans DSM 11115]